MARRRVAKEPGQPRVRRWPNILEKDFQQMVLNVARPCGWLAYHTYDSRRSDPGFPDLTLVRGERLLFAELKTVKGRLSDTQEHWLALLTKVPCTEVYLWRPTDWDAIVETLSR